MRYGHTTGTKKETRNSQSWYAEIEAQQIARIDAEQAAKDDAERALVTALATQVGRAVTMMPEAASRIAKAATLTQKREVWPMSDGTWLVGSQSDTVAAHLVKRGPWSCTCEDATYRHTICKHQIAVMLTVKIGATYHANYTMPEAA